VAIVIDTSVLIDHLRGDERAVARLRSAVDIGEELWSVTVVRTEILAGSRPAEREAIIRLFDQLRWLDVTPELADSAGLLATNYVGSHQGIDTVDYLLAAGAAYLGGQLLTMNVRHFPMIDGLEPAY
jgi:predicted nucleic acid-binding protein